MQQARQLQVVHVRCHTLQAAVGAAKLTLRLLLGPASHRHPPQLLLLLLRRGLLLRLSAAVL
jgi:hypothetical protein